MAGAQWRQEKQQIARETGLSPDKVQEFREIFGLVDLDAGGAISADELMQLTELLNMGVTKEEVERMVQEIDTSGSGEVRFRDFIIALACVPKVDYNERDVIKAFRVLAGPRWGPDPKEHGPERGTISLDALENAIMHIDEGRIWKCVDKKIPAGTNIEQEKLHLAREISTSSADEKGKIFSVTDYSIPPKSTEHEAAQKKNEESKDTKEVLQIYASAPDKDLGSQSSEADGGLNIGQESLQATKPYPAIKQKVYGLVDYKDTGDQRHDVKTKQSKKVQKKEIGIDGGLNTKGKHIKAEWTRMDGNWKRTRKGWEHKEGQNVMTAKGAREVSTKAMDGMVNGMLNYNKYVRLMMAGAANIEMDSSQRQGRK